MIARCSISPLIILIIDHVIYNHDGRGKNINFSLGSYLLTLLSLSNIKTLVLLSTVGSAKYDSAGNIKVVLNIIVNIETKLKTDSFDGFSGIIETSVFTQQPGSIKQLGLAEYFLLI